MWRNLFSVKLESRVCEGLKGGFHLRSCDVCGSPSWWIIHFSFLTLTTFKNWQFPFNSSVFTFTSNFNFSRTKTQKSLFGAGVNDQSSLKEIGRFNGQICFYMSVIYEECVSSFLRALITLYPFQVLHSDGNQRTRGQEVWSSKKSWSSDEALMTSRLLLEISLKRLELLELPPALHPMMAGTLMSAAVPTASALIPVFHYNNSDFHNYLFGVLSELVYIWRERKGKTRTCEVPALQRGTVTPGLRLFLSTGVEGHKVTASHHHHGCSGGSAPPDWDGHNCHDAWRNSPVTSTNHAGQKSASCINAVHQREWRTPGGRTEKHLFRLSVLPPKKDGSDHNQEYLWSSDSKLRFQAFVMQTQLTAAVILTLCRQRSLIWFTVCFSPIYRLPLEFWLAQHLHFSQLAKLMTGAEAGAAVPRPVRSSVSFYSWC